MKKIVKQDVIDDIIATSPIPIFVQSMKEWERQLGQFRPTLFGDMSRYNGMRVRLTDDTAKKIKRPGHFIVVEQRLPNYIKARTLLHEIGHTRYNGNKKYYSHSHGEFTAEKYAMDQLVKREMYESALDSLRWTVGWATGVIYDIDESYYARAANRLLKSKPYRRCISKVLAAYRFKQTLKDVDKVVRLGKKHGTCIDIRFVLKRKTDGRRNNSSRSIR